MRPKKYITALLYVFVASGVLTGLMWAMRAEFWSGFRFGLIFAIGLTLFVALVLLPLDFFFTKNVSNGELDVNSAAELKLTGDIADVFQTSVEILSSLGTMRSVQPLKQEMTIAARTKASLFSFGEQIILRFTCVKEGEVSIQISSEPVFKYTKIDYGTNLKNVKFISRAIAESLKTSKGEKTDTV
jgi:hypothetical protein